MMKLFLASALSEMKQQLLEKMGSLDGKKIAYITNPADNDIVDENEREILWWLKNDRDMLEECGVILVHVDLRIIQNIELKEILENLDGIYVSGGDTYYFSELARESGYAIILHELLTTKGKFYLSTSAGSCIMGNKKFKYSKEIVSGREEYLLFDGFNFIPSMILPHRGSKEFKSDYDYVLEFIYKEKQSIITLTDQQALRVTENGIEIVRVS